MNLLNKLIQKSDGKRKKNILLVNIVIPRNGWILSKIGKRTAENCKIDGIKMKTSHEADQDADVNYYCDVQNTYFGQKTKLDIGYITHADRDSVAWLSQLVHKRNALKNLNGIVLMNSRYTKMCEQVGFPKEKLTTITPGQTYDKFKLKKIIIGIVSRGGHPGYGQGFIEELFSKHDLSGFNFRFLGSGWDNVLPIAKAKNIEAELLPDKDYSIYPKFYHEIDYLLIPGLWTAGPMSFQECLASGVPVISADVGFAGFEFQPDYIFPPGNTLRLYKILQQIRKPMIKRRKQVETMSWENYAKQLIMFFEKMRKLKEKNRKFTYYTIIGRDLGLLKGHVNNVKKYAGFDRLKCEKEFLVIIYRNKKISKKTTRSLLKFCERENIKTHIYDESTKVFIENLYACWNLGYELADEGYVFRGGSDQIFSKDSFLHLHNAAEKLRKKGVKNTILQANTIENKSRLEQIGATSRHFTLDIGDKFENFKYPLFEKFIISINMKAKNKLIDINEALSLWKKPTKIMTSLGIINRCDGCSWLMTKNDWRKYGPLPVIEDGITGDVLIHDKLQKAGYKEYIVRDCVTYHFVRGESMDKY